MAWYADTLWCDGCGVEIYWAPLERNELEFCCRRCLRGEECDCEEFQEEYPSNLVSQADSYSQNGV